MFATRSVSSSSIYTCLSREQFLRVEFYSQKRGRDYEQSIQLEYLQNLNRRYDDFIKNKYPGRVITIEKDNLDFLNIPKDLSGIIDKIDATLFGLF